MLHNYRCDFCQVTPLRNQINFPINSDIVVLHKWIPLCPPVQDLWNLFEFQKEIFSHLECQQYNTEQVFTATECQKNGCKFIYTYRSILRFYLGYGYELWQYFTCTDQEVLQKRRRILSSMALSQTWETCRYSVLTGDFWGLPGTWLLFSPATSPNPLVSSMPRSNSSSSRCSLKSSCRPLGVRSTGLPDICGPFIDGPLVGPLLVEGPAVGPLWVL